MFSAIHLVIHPWIYLLIQLDICLPVHSSIHLPTHLSTNTSIPLFGWSVIKSARQSVHIYVLPRPKPWTGEGRALTSTGRLLCARQGAGLLTYWILTLIPEASTKLPTYRGEKLAQRHWMACLETVNQWETEPRSHPGSPWLYSPCLFPFLFNITVYTTTQSQ